MKLYEWRCPAPDDKHPEMWGDLAAYKTVGDGQVPVYSRTCTPGTQALQETAPERPWRCFWCGAPLERVREIVTKTP